MLKIQTLLLAVFLMSQTQCQLPQSQNQCLATIASGGKAVELTPGIQTCMCGNTVKAGGGACQASELTQLDPLTEHQLAEMVDGAEAVLRTQQILNSIAGAQGFIIKWDNPASPPGGGTGGGGSQQGLTYTGGSSGGVIQALTFGSGSQSENSTSNSNPPSEGTVMEFFGANPR